MTPTEKTDFIERMKTKVKELNALISESNADLKEGETRLSIVVEPMQWNPMSNADTVRSLNKYVACYITEKITY